MTKRDRIVSPAPDGGWNNNRNGAGRASSHHDTQAEAIAAARAMLGNAGGGELSIQGTDGRIRAKDTVPDGNDPRETRG